MSAGAGPAPDGIRFASAFSIVTCDECDCGLITLRLHAADGTIFAAILMPRAIAVVAVEQFGLCIRKSGLTGLAALPAAGRA